MITLRKGDERGHFDHGWLDTKHTFSFSDYFDPKHMGFRHLRVINEDVVSPGEGFDTHPHRDMEIVTYVLQGALKHRDSMGNGSVIRPGEVQRMSAGTGITHSEFNESDREPVHLLQIWILPGKKGIEPSYEQKAFSAEDRADRLRLVASSDGREGSVLVHQDVSLYVSNLGLEREVRHSLGQGRHAWVQVASGRVELNGRVLGAGDGAAVSDEQELRFKGLEKGEFLLFDLS